MTSLKPTFEGCPYFCTWYLYCRLPSMYMLRAYQSPYSADDCGPQCAHSPNFASRNHSGIRYACRDSGGALNGPAAISGFRSCAPAVTADPSNAIADRLVIILVALVFSVCLSYLPLILSSSNAS